jgi:hypothetical protein
VSAGDDCEGVTRPGTSTASPRWVANPRPSRPDPATTTGRPPETGPALQFARPLAGSRAAGVKHHASGTKTRQHTCRRATLGTSGPPCTHNSRDPPRPAGVCACPPSCACTPPRSLPHATKLSPHTGVAPPAGFAHRQTVGELHQATRLAVGTPQRHRPHRSTPQRQHACRGDPAMRHRHDVGHSQTRAPSANEHYARPEVLEKWIGGNGIGEREEE